MTTEPATRLASPTQLAWLSREMDHWRSRGLVSDDTAIAILGSYRAQRRFGLSRLLLLLGVAFLAVGLIWLVAANLDALPPLGRFIFVLVLWLGVLTGAELLAQRRAHRGTPSSPVVGALRLLAAAVFGAVVFQAAQSLQVPALEPKLVGLWAAVALVHAYVVRSAGPLLVGLATGVFWLVSQSVWNQPSGLAFVLALLGAGVLGVAMGGVHARWQPRFAAPWREAGALLLLAGLFAAALPEVTAKEFQWSVSLAVVLVAAGIAVMSALALPPGVTWFEPAAALTITAAAVLLVLWEAGADADRVGAADWAHASLSVLAYVAAAVAVAVAGTLRDSWRLTAMATAGLVLFTTVQSFAVFAQIIDGAWLFLVLGLVFLGTGFGFDRARREIAATLDSETPAGEGR